MAPCQHHVSGAVQRAAMTSSTHLLPVIVSDAVAVLVAAALSSSEPGLLLERAAAAATTTGQRQLLAIATAHLDGDSERVDVLARDHLADHPWSVLVAWMCAQSKTAETTRKETT